MEKDENEISFIKNVEITDGKADKFIYTIQQ